MRSGCSLKLATQPSQKSEDTSKQCNVVDLFRTFDSQHSRIYIFVCLFISFLVCSFGLGMDAGKWVCLVLGVLVAYL